MSDDKIENPISYSQLQALEDDFEDVELELRTFQTIPMTKRIDDR